MKQKYLMGCLAFATLVGFNFRHAFNDYGLAMSSFLMAYASDSSSDGTDGTGTDGTTGTGTDGTDGTGTDTSTDPFSDKKYNLERTIITLECKAPIYDEYNYNEEGARVLCGRKRVRASRLVEMLYGKEGVESVKTSEYSPYTEDEVPCRFYGYHPEGGKYTRDEAIDCEPTCSRPLKCKR